MRITESNVTMSAARAFSQSGAKARGAINKNSFEDTRSALSSGEYNTGGLDTFNKGSYAGMSGMDLFNNYSKIGGTSFNGLGSGLSLANDLQNNILSMLLGRFSMSGAFGGGGFTQQLVTYEEYESTQFHANGQARTDDGRVIDFNVDIMMSRSYMEYMNIYIPSVQNALCDPLIVNVGSDTANVRDQKFKFDIDADGVEDDISMLGKGSGFLALDKNGDGVINDGSELFGTKSGDGFADLREYDSDGNGWIDENDEIFSKLKVWCKGDNGEDILMSLKEADIGAIYLGSQETEFTMSGDDNVRDGVVRSTGVFLRESAGGGAGTIQHVDMAIGEAGEAEGSGVGMAVTQTLTVSNISTTETRSSSNSQSQAKRREALAKKRAEEQQTKKALEQKRMDKKIAQEEYEQRLSDRRLERKEYYKKMDEKRQERMKKYREHLEEQMLDRLFEDREMLLA